MTSVVGHHVEGKDSTTLPTSRSHQVSVNIDQCFSSTYIPCAYMDPFYGSGMVGYGPHSMVHPQVGASAPSRVPLPNELSEDGPIYVNAKQYHAILRRRQLRAKLEAKNKLIKGRKPYLHESRHLHAMKRVRGSGAAS
ncbi:unnamed protein product [Spirodela intermedia]|uniref:Nuclear transcription factor Y subunit n=1 Tax=Spirodela intermedia TaxID=51605 RepID=A0A7I8J3Q5_SPIIN|nr:unnamed protein product [Spirodela intermedia]CAA6664691.1 unnamed protein product [Spirodela intermedia]